VGITLAELALRFGSWQRDDACLSEATPNIAVRSRRCLHFVDPQQSRKNDWLTALSISSGLAQHVPLDNIRGAVHRVDMVCSVQRTAQTT
jgi:hypothetical protein